MNAPQPDRDKHGKASPWRQPVMWLVIGLPLASVAAGIFMVVVAGGSDAIDTSPDQVQRTAQIQTTDLGPDEVARAERLSAVVRLDRQHGQVEVLPVSGDFPRNAPLKLALAHPTRAGLDVELSLQPTELGWQASAALDPGHDWNVRLGPADARWRLQGRLPRGQLATHLRPRLEPR